MARLPQVSGRRLIKLLESLGYIVVRQRGSHARLRRTTAAGEHHITVPDHRVMAKGTLNDILSAIATHTGIPTAERMKRLGA